MDTEITVADLYTWLESQNHNTDAAALNRMVGMAEDARADQERDREEEEELGVA